MTDPYHPARFMSLREHYAGIALSIVAHRCGGCSPGDEAIVARKAVMLADEMIAMLNASAPNRGDAHARPCE